MKETDINACFTFPFLLSPSLFLSYVSKIYARRCSATNNSRNTVALPELASRCLVFKSFFLLFCSSRWLDVKSHSFIVLVNLTRSPRCQSRLQGRRMNAERAGGNCTFEECKWHAAHLILEPFSAANRRISRFAAKLKNFLIVSLIAILRGSKSEPRVRPINRNQLCNATPCEISVL